MLASSGCRAAAHSASLTLLGQYTTADFSLATDGHGGSVVTAPSITGLDATPFLAPNHNTG